MKELLEYLIKGILGNENYSIAQTEEGGQNHFTISVPKEYIGLVIGKGGKTIKAIRNLLKVRATLEKVGASLSVEEKS